MKLRSYSYLLAQKGKSQESEKFVINLKNFFRRVYVKSEISLKTTKWRLNVFNCTCTNDFAAKNI